MSLLSAGLLLYRRSRAGVEVLLVHPGGPFFRNRDDGWWTVPKGLVGAGEDPLAAARREFEEETSFAPPADAEYLDLGSDQAEGRQGGAGVGGRGRLRSRCSCAATRSAWSGRRARGERASFPRSIAPRSSRIEEARRKILAAQAPFLDRLPSV